MNRKSLYDVIKYGISEGTITAYGDAVMDDEFKSPLTKTEALAELSAYETYFREDEETGEIVEVHCTYDPATKGGWSNDGRKVKGTLHWVSAEKAVNAKVRLYDHLFTTDNPSSADDLEDVLNPDSLEVLTECKVEPGLLEAKSGDRFQFLRHGYFCVDKDSSSEKLIFNRTVSMRDSWAKIQKQMQNRGRKS
jgi:glutaminyl-tRNA synthetase